MLIQRTGSGSCITQLFNVCQENIASLTVSTSTFFTLCQVFFGSHTRYGSKYLWATRELWHSGALLCTRTSRVGSVHVIRRCAVELTVPYYHRATTRTQLTLYLYSQEKVDVLLHTDVHTDCYYCPYFHMFFVTLLGHFSFFFLTLSLRPFTMKWRVGGWKHKRP